MRACLTITGRTRVFGIIADPIGHVHAPSVFNPLFEKHGVDAVMVPLHVRPDDLGTTIAGLRALPNFGGMAITLPHKVTMMEQCQEIGRLGRLIGAVNFAAFDEDRRLIGDNCDGLGFLDGLRAAGWHGVGRLSGQMATCYALWCRLAEAGKVRNGSYLALTAYIERMCGKQDLYRADQLSMVIEALKQWAKREEAA